MEWSLQTREIEAEVVPTARELGVGIVPYSPLGRGFLADLSAFDALAPTDSRTKIDRFQGDNLAENKRRIQGYFEVAERVGCTPAQLALAWLHSQGDDVVPIPGTKRDDRVVENARAFLLAPLAAADREAVESAVSLVGERAPPMSKAHNFNNRI
jgi:aryl-alcohol dehydrogenase-like predicted oxidoreductase